MRLSRISYIALLLLNQNAFADTIQWLGGTGNWSDAANWNPAVAPNNGATHYQATINSGSADTVTLDMGAALDSLSLGASSGTNTSTLGITGQTLTLGSATVSPVLQVNAKGVLNVNAGGVLAFDLGAGNSTTNSNAGSINLAGGTLAVTGGSTNALTLGGTGTTTLNAGTITGSGAEAVTLAGALSGSGSIANLASFRTQSSITVNSGQSLNVNNVNTVILESPSTSNTLVVNGGSVALGGRLQINNNRAGLNLSNGGTVTVAGSLDSGPGLTSYFGNGVVLQGTGTSFSAQGGSFAGPFNIGTGGQVDLRGGAWTAYDGGTHTLSNKALTLGGDMHIDGGPVYTSTGSITLQGGGLYYGAGAGNNALTSLSKVSGLTLKNGSNLSITPSTGTLIGTVTLGSAGVADTSSLTVNGAFGTGVPSSAATAGNVTANQGNTFSAQGGTLGSASAQLGGSIDLRGGTLANYDPATQKLSGFSVTSSPVFNAFGGAIQYDGGPVQTIADTVWVAFGASSGVNGSITAWNGGVAIDPFATLDTLQGRLSISNPTYTINPTGGTLTMQKVSFDPILDIGSATGTGTSVVTINGALIDNGRLRINNGSSLFTQGFSNTSSPVFPNYGVTIGTGALLDARGGAFGSLDAAGTLAAATYSISSGGQLLYDGGDIKNLDAKLYLDGAGAAIKHGAGVGSDPFGALTTINGGLQVNNGSVYSITPDGGTLTLGSTGFLNLAGSNTSTGTAVTVNGNIQLNGSSGGSSIVVSTKDSSLIVNGNVTGTGGIQVNGQNALFKVTGDYTQTAGSFTTTSSATGPQAFDIGGNVAKSGSMSLSTQTMNVGGDFSNLAGSFSVGGAFSASAGRGTLNIGGKLQNDASFSINASSTSAVLGGTVNVTQNAVNTKTLTLGAASSASSRAGELHVGGDFSNTTTATLTGGKQATMSVGGNFTNAGTANFGVSDSVSVAGGYTQTAGKTSIGSGGTITANGGFFLQGGNMGGAGTYQGDVTITGGSFAPGDSTTPTITTVTGDYIQLAGITAMVIGSASSYDQILVGNDMLISGGTLKVTYLAGYTPQLGDFFRFFTVGNQFLGSWSAYDFQALPSRYYFVEEMRGGVLGVAVAMPEPACWTLLLAGAATLGRWRGKGQSAKH